MSHQTTVTDASEALPVELADAKQHLRIYHDDLDTEIQAALEAAIDYCETVTGRALREEVTVSQTYSGWDCEPIRFDRQPVKSITSITYYDSDGVSQEVDEADYRLTLSTNAAASLQFDDAFAKPLLYEREDAITIEYVAGYESATVVPARAKHAIKLKLAELFGNLDDRKTEANRRACDDMLASLDWGSYR